MIVCFSGHGVHLDGKSYLCPPEDRLDDPKTLIPLDDVYEQLRNCPAMLKLFIVDAWFTRIIPFLFAGTPSGFGETHMKSLPWTASQLILVAMLVTAGVPHAAAQNRPAHATSFVRLAPDAGRC